MPGPNFAANMGNNGPHCYHRGGEGGAVIINCNEMAALAVFMAGVSAQRPFPVRYMDSAIDLYLNTCKVPQLATRAALLSAECLWQVGQASVAAGQLIRLTSEGSDLRSALLLEQAALCFLRATPICPRKFAFHLVLSGHRFAKAAHRRHALHAYSQALQVRRCFLFNFSTGSVAVKP
ncbi:hypothetical protein HPB51_010691 [Rhipicephalus microplus]|uniref:Uncharacterized protein n=1 Tax=Rhipicephalus microplus TaxID=6941 RepID=A0A9J6D9T6_RHIMP|nr:hypothetical protein HPB51_010691 [Rhipicephalus microplus]